MTVPSSILGVEQAPNRSPSDWIQRAYERTRRSQLTSLAITCSLRAVTWFSEWRWVNSCYQTLIVSASFEVVSEHVYFVWESLKTYDTRVLICHNPGCLGRCLPHLLVLEPLPLGWFTLPLSFAHLHEASALIAKRGIKGGSIRLVTSILNVWRYAYYGATILLLLCFHNQPLVYFNVAFMIQPLCMRLFQFLDNVTVKLMTTL